MNWLDIVIIILLIISTIGGLTSGFIRCAAHWLELFRASFWRHILIIGQRSLRM